MHGRRDLRGRRDRDDAAADRRGRREAQEVSPIQSVHPCLLAHGPTKAAPRHGAIPSGRRVRARHLTSLLGLAVALAAFGAEEEPVAAPAPTKVAEPALARAARADE